MNKYAKLTEDLKSAYEEAKKVATGEDGGSANLDSTFLRLKGWREERVVEAIKEAGLWCPHKTNWIGKGYMINTYGGQGNDNTRVRDKFKSLLEDKGYDVLGFDQMD